MKKVFFVVMATAAISFTSCGGNKTGEASADAKEQTAEQFNAFVQTQDYGGGN